MPRTRSTLAALGTALALAGCLGTTEAPRVASPTDEQLVLAALDQRLDWTGGNLGQKDDSPDGMADPDSFDAGMAGPGVFRRVMDSTASARLVSLFDLGADGRPTRAVVRVTTRIEGRLLQSLEGPGGPYRTEKPLREDAVFIATLTRESGTDAWSAVSLSRPRTASPSTSVELQSVRIQGAGLDWTLNDPDGSIAPGWRFWPVGSGPISVTVVTSDPEQIVTLIDHERRFPFANNGDGSYSRTFTPEEIDQIHRFAVYVVAAPGLSIPTAPYDAAGWMLFVLDRAGAPTL